MELRRDRLIASIRRGFYALATFLTHIKRDSTYRDIACTHLHITYTAGIITYDRS